LFLTKELNKSFEVTKINRKNFAPELLKSISFNTLKAEKWNENNWNILPIDLNIIFEKINKNKKLKDITTNIFQGPIPGADEVFVLDFVSEQEDKITCFSKFLNEKVVLEKQITKKYIKGKFIKKYYIDYSANQCIIYPFNSDAKTYTKEFLSINFPLAFKYFSKELIKNKLESREKGRFKNTFWQFSRPQNINLLNLQKIVTPFNAFSNSFCFDENCDFIFTAGVAGGYGILLKEECKIDKFYLLGILNSKLIEIFIRNFSTCLQGGYYSYENRYIKDIPIKMIDFANSEEMKFYDKIIVHVKTLLDIKKRISLSNLSTEKDTLNQRISYLIDEIDNIVFRLYDISDEEIITIENHNA